VCCVASANAHCGVFISCCTKFVLGLQVMTEPFKTKATDLQPVVLVGDCLTLPVDVTDLNPANHVLRVRSGSGSGSEVALAFTFL